MYIHGLVQGTYLQLKAVSQFHVLVDDQDGGCLSQMYRENCFERSLLTI